MISISSKLPTILRILVGLVFTIFGLNGFLNFMPQPPQPEAAGAFLGGLAGAGYFFPMLKLTEIVAGVALLANRFVPLALAVLAPVVVNIAAFHVFLSPGGLPIALVLVVALAATAYAYRDAYRPMLAARVEPATAVASSNHAAPAPAE